MPPPMLMPRCNCGVYLEPQLKQRGVEGLFYDVELPLIQVLLDMEFNGVALDVKYLGEVSVQITQRMREIEKEIYNHAGMVFNINSPKQLGEVLFGKLQLPTQASWKTASGAFSTAVDVLEALKDKHPIVQFIMEQRELSKLQGHICRRAAGAGESQDGPGAHRL